MVGDARNQVKARPRAAAQALAPIPALPDHERHEEGAGARRPPHEPAALPAEVCPHLASLRHSHRPHDEPVAGRAAPPHVLHGPRARRARVRGGPPSGARAPRDLSRSPVPRRARRSLRQGAPGPGAGTHRVGGHDGGCGQRATGQAIGGSRAVALHAAPGRPSRGGPRDTCHPGATHHAAGRRRGQPEPRHRPRQLLPDGSRGETATRSRRRHGRHRNQ